MDRVFRLEEVEKEHFAKLRRLSGEHFVGAVEQQFAMYRKAGDEAGEAAYRETFYRRMWDVSMYMKAVKQRFAQWYNGRVERKGTLWEERFRSVVVDGAGKGGWVNPVGDGEMANVER